MTGTGKRWTVIDGEHVRPHGYRDVGEPKYGQGKALGMLPEDWLDENGERLVLRSTEPPPARPQPRVRRKRSAFIAGLEREYARAKRGPRARMLDMMDRREHYDRSLVRFIPSPGVVGPRRPTPLIGCTSTDDWTNGDTPTERWVTEWGTLLAPGITDGHRLRTLWLQRDEDAPHGVWVSASESPNRRKPEGRIPDDQRRLQNAARSAADEGYSLEEIFEAVAPIYPLRMNQRPLKVHTIHAWLTFQRKGNS